MSDTKRSPNWRGVPSEWIEAESTQYARQSAVYCAQDIFMESDQIKCEQSKFYTVQFSYLYTIVGRIP